MNKPHKGGERLIMLRTEMLIKEIEDDSKKWKAIPCSNHNYVEEGGSSPSPRM